MKLKFVHQNQENRVAEEQLVKEEEPPLQHSSPSRDLSPVSAFHPVILYGKRKRKPKELIDEVSPINFRKQKKSSTSKSADGTLDSGRTLSSSSGDMKLPIMIRAEEVQMSLGNDQPTFLKLLVRSHVASCFWMGLPVPFCKIHLPTKDTIVNLENEEDEEFPVKYIAHKTGLSAGWRKFVAGNKLLEGDVLIFQLIGPCRFKVYIIRANDLNEVDGALSLLILDSHTKQHDSDASMIAHSKNRKRQRSLPLTVVQKRKQEEDLIVPTEEHSGNDSDEVASEVLEGSKFSGPSSQFKDVKSFSEFHIVVNGACIDSELPEEIRRKYYDLCYGKNALLHDQLLPGLYNKLAAGMIVETVNIADGLRNCKLTTAREDFQVWEKSLRSFELLGLNVGFLRARLRRLVNLGFESEGALEIRRYREAQMEQRQTEVEIEKVEAKLVELKELCGKYGNDMQKLKMKAERHEMKFEQEVLAPW